MMASLLYPDEEQAQIQAPQGGPLSLLQPPDDRPPALRPDPRADALGTVYQQVMDAMEAQRRISAERGLWDDNTGLPTKAGLLDAIGQAGTAVALGTGGAPERPGFTAYHGSPHQFDAFDLSKIGTGEGAQAYGHGMYLADREGVARGYRDALSRVPNDQLALMKDLETNSGLQMPVISGIASARSPQQEAAAYLRYLEKTPPHYADYPTAMEQAARLREHLPNIPDAPLPSVAAVNAYEAANADFKARVAELNRARLAGDPVSPAMMAEISASQNQMLAARAAIPPSGHMYEVRVNADPAHFLDWDKPLNQQSEHVKQAIANSPYAGYEKTNLPGGQLVPQTLAGAQALHEAGIPGIRYLDQGSRGAGEGSRNSVVFSPEIMEIIRRYGLAGLMAGGGGVATGYQQQ
jgi:hypothetical protein